MSSLALQRDVLNGSIAKIGPTFTKYSRISNNVFSGWDAWMMINIFCRKIRNLQTIVDTILNVAAQRQKRTIE